MKKFWNLMLVALVVMLGATACTENLDSVDVKDDAGLSFYAEIDMAATRVDIADEDGDKTWETIWEGNESLTLVDGDTNNRYTFANSEAEPNKFTCTEDGVAELLGGKVTVLSESSVDTYTSYVGKKFLAVSTTVDNFDNTQKVSLTTNASFLRYTYNGEGAISFTMTTDHQVASQQMPFLDENMAKTSTVTFEGVNGENWVPFVPRWSVDGLTATLSYSIDGVECKQTTISNVKSGKIYNLGTLTEPEPEDLAKIYFVPNVSWKGDGAWFSAHFFNSTDSFADVKLTDADADGIYECSVPANMEKVLFCRMNPAFTEFAWNQEGATAENLHVWNQTADETIGVEPDNYYYILDWAKGVWGNKDGYELPAVNLGVVGFGGNWATDIDMTLEGEYYTLKGKEIYATDSFKIRANDAWDESYGVEGTDENIAIKSDQVYTLVKDGKNMMVPAGVYDLYFNYATKEFKAERVGNLENQETPNLPCAWSLCGTFNNWGDAAMVTTEVKNLFVVKNVTLTAYASFKVRKDKAWTENYGGGIVYMNPNGYIQVYSNGSDISNTAAGKFDIYFDYTSKLLYMVDAGADYTTVSKQTVEGQEPKQEEPEVTANVLYLKPNANWKKDNARFAAYFFGNGDKWVSMVDSDKDGIYEVNIPEGYDYGCNVIFCRMNPSTTANNWNNKWNQTSDLKAPTDGKNLYTVKENTWDKGGGTWSVK